MLRLLSALIMMIFAMPLAAQAAYAQSYQDIALHDKRLAQIGYRLSKANADFCERKTPDIGWVLHDIAQYGDRNAAQTAFGFEKQISVLALVDGGPAALAGVQEGDGFVGISYERSFHDAMETIDISINSAPYANIELQNHYDRIEMVQHNIKLTLTDIGKFEDAMPIVTLMRNGKKIKQPVNIAMICASDYILDVREKIDAGANGKHVRMTLGLSQFLQDDAEYAAAIAHELAHNILEHRKMIADGKAGHGPLAGLGRNKSIRATEQQADRLAIWLMANAGYDVAAGPRMIERLSTRKGRPLLGYRTHNKWKKRLNFMKQEIAALDNVRPNAQGRRAPPLMRYSKIK